MLRILLCFCLGVLALPTLADIYRWVDDSGRVLYSDRYREGAERVDVGPLSTYKAAPAPKYVPGRPKVEPAADLYQEFVIQRPEQEATVRANDGRVSVSLLTRPALRDGDQVEIALDGTPHPQRLSATQFTLNDVVRGTHSLQATIYDAAGSKLITSDPVTFHVQRVSVGGRPGIAPAPPIARPRPR